MFGQMVSVGGGLVALQSLLTIKKGTSPFNIRSNELFSKFLRQKWSFQNFYQMYFGKIRGLCVCVCGHFRISIRYISGKYEA